MPTWVYNFISFVAGYFLGAIITFGMMFLGYYVGKEK